MACAIAMKKLEIRPTIAHLSTSQGLGYFDLGTTDVPFTSQYLMHQSHVPAI